MGSRKFRLHDGRRGAALAVRVTPQASHDQITEIVPDGSLKIGLSVPSVDGDGNKALVSFMAGVLGVNIAQIDILGGQTGQDKLISVLDIDSEEVHQRIQAYLKKNNKK